jgi:hypothetical protein
MCDADATFWPCATGAKKCGTRARVPRCFGDPINGYGSEPMPIILWLLGVPLGLVIVLFLLGVV